VFFISCIHPIEFTDSFKLLREKILKGFGSQQTQGVAIAEVKLCLEDDATVQELLRKNQVVLETLDPQLAWLKLLKLIRKKVDEVISDVTTPEQQAKLDLLAALNDLKFLFYALDTIDNAKLIVKHLLGSFCHATAPAASDYTELTALVTTAVHSLERRIETQEQTQAKVLNALRLTTDRIQSRIEGRVAKNTEIATKQNVEAMGAAPIINIDDIFRDTLLQEVDETQVTECREAVSELIEILKSATSVDEILRLQHAKGADAREAVSTHLQNQIRDIADSQPTATKRARNVLDEVKAFWDKLHTGAQALMQAQPKCNEASIQAIMTVIHVFCMKFVNSPYVLRDTHSNTKQGSQPDHCFLIPYTTAADGGNINWEHIAFIEEIKPNSISGSSALGQLCNRLIGLDCHDNATTMSYLTNGRKMQLYFRQLVED